MPTLDGKDVKITVDRTCTACGLCVKVCPCEYLAVKDGSAAERPDAPMGCITCGQCAAICPEAAMHVEAEGLHRDDVFPFPPGATASYGSLYRLMAGRRSVRKFGDVPVATSDVQKILDAAQAAPVGIPPSGVKVMVVSGKDKVRGFVDDLLKDVAKKSFIFSPAGVWLLRPLMSAEDHKDLRTKIVPLIKAILDGHKQGEDFLLYDAPLAMVFMCRAEEADAVIAATHAVLAAEALGLGSCMIGMVVPMLGMAQKETRQKYGVPEDSRKGLAVVFGTPQLHFARGVRHPFAKEVRI